jgi:hypothetical protein
MAAPKITADFTGIWVEWWNDTFTPWLDSNIAVGGSGSFPFDLSLNGRIVSDYADTLKPTTPPSASLAVLLPEGFKFVYNGAVYTAEEDIYLGPITANFNGWVSATVTYNEDSDTYDWTPIETPLGSGRPAYGSGVIAKVEALSDRVDTVDAEGNNSDIIPTMPVLLQIIRAASSGGEGSGSGDIYLTNSNVKLSPDDPRNAFSGLMEIIDEKIAAVLEAVEAGGQKEAPTETDQLWLNQFGLMRAVREVVPSSLRFVNAASARPGIQGTVSAPDTEQNDKGGTLPEVPQDRNYQTGG